MSLPVPPAPSAAEGRLLHLLKMRGPQTASALARRLGVTATAVRQHLARLEEGDWVRHEEVRGGVGRPHRVWTASPQADGLFPDSHADLAVGMVEDVRRSFGSAGLERVIAARVRRQAADYRERVPADAPLEKRVAALARVRCEEGYLAAVERDGDGTLHLVENHCPICAAAKACTGLCDGELTLFRQVLGPGVGVEREEHLLAGARRCRYRIRPA